MWLVTRYWEKQMDPFKNMLERRNEIRLLRLQAIALQLDLDVYQWCFIVNDGTEAHTGITITYMCRDIAIKSCFIGKWLFKNVGKYPSLYDNSMYVLRVSRDSTFRTSSHRGTAWFEILYIIWKLLIYCISHHTLTYHIVLHQCLVKSNGAWTISPLSSLQQHLPFVSNGISFLYLVSTFLQFVMWIVVAEICNCVDNLGNI